MYLTNRMKKHPARSKIKKIEFILSKLEKNIDGLNVAFLVKKDMEPEILLHHNANVHKIKLLSIKNKVIC